MVSGMQKRNTARDRAGPEPNVVSSKTCAKRIQFGRHIHLRQLVEQVHLAKDLNRRTKERRWSLSHARGGFVLTPEIIRIRDIPERKCTGTSLLALQPAIAGTVILLQLRDCRKHHSSLYQTGSTPAQARPRGLLTTSKWTLLAQIWLR